MKLVAILTLVLNCLVLGQAAADESDLSRFSLRDESTLEMLMPGAGFFDDQKSKEALKVFKNVPWLALVDGPNGRLQRRSIRVRHEKPGTNGYGPQLSAEVVGKGRKPLMLLRPYPGLRAGPVQRWLGLTSFNGVTEDHPLRIHGDTSVILERANAEPTTAPGPATSPCQLVLVSDHGRQVLDHPSCTEVDGKLSINYSDLSMTWAGDLDHDGKPDFIFAHSGEVSFYSLALSSAASDNELIRIVEVYEVPDWC